jgi:hypothetical protein
MDVLIALSLTFGLILIGVLLIFLINQFNLIVFKTSNHDFILSGLLFIFLTMLAYSVGRANDPIELVFESRYAITMTIGLCLLLLLFEDQFANRFYLKCLFLMLSICFCLMSYTSKVLAFVNFNQVVTANFIKHHLQHREHFFYKSSEGNKVDLTQPLISKDYLLPKPMVSLSTTVIGSMTYLNEVIDISFSHHYAKLDPELMAIGQFSTDNFSTPLPAHQNHIADFNLVTKNKVIFYQNAQAKSLITRGSDGYFMVLRDTMNHYWIFNMFWQQFDLIHQFSDFEGIHVQNLSGNIPFKYFPDGIYTLRIIHISGAKKEVLGELTQVKMFGI